MLLRFRNDTTQVNEYNNTVRNPTFEGMVIVIYTQESKFLKCSKAWGNQSTMSEKVLMFGLVV